MTQLYIDNQQVTLPAEFSLEITKENPFFTKGGSFSFDIKLSLLDDQNARIYKHINRLQSNTFHTGRSAILIADSKVILEGVEIILESNEESVTIQLAAGNAQLNFLIGGERKLRTINIGPTPVLTDVLVKDSWTKQYPELSYVGAPVKVIVENSKTIINNTSAYNLKYNKDGIAEVGSFGIDKSEFIAQPYLSFIIESIVTSLGYRITRNDVINSIYNTLYIVHSYKVTNWQDMLPDMTVNEFLTAIETLLDVRIICNDKNNTVEICSTSNYLADLTNTFHPEITDTFKREVLEQDQAAETVQTSNIGYKVGGSNWYKYQSISLDTLSYINQTICVDYQHVVDAVLAFGNMGEEIINKQTFLDTSTDWLFRGVKDGQKWVPERINLLKPIIRPDAATEIEIPIYPSQIDFDKCIYTEYTGNGQLAFQINTHVIIPVTDRVSGTTIEDLSIDEVILGNKGSNTIADDIQVAFWLGKVQFREAGKEGDIGDSGKGYFPTSIIDHIDQFVKHKVFSIDKQRRSLTLTGTQGDSLDEKIYSLSTPISTLHEYTLNCVLNKTMPKTDSIIIAKGRRFTVKEIKYKITEKGIDPNYKLVVYPL